MATYTAISRDAMDSFLNARGFREIKLAGCFERVYAKIVKHNDITYSLRVYSSIEEGHARGKGADAIRVTLFWRENEDAAPRIVGADTRVHRVEGWRKNLQNRLDNWKELLGKPCKCCKAPTVLRKPKGKAKWEPFFGCVNYPTCKGTAE